MFELTINNHKVGVFKTLREARAYEPTWIDTIAAGMNALDESYTYTRIIKKLRTSAFNRPSQPVTNSNEAQNESI